MKTPSASNVGSLNFIILESQVSMGNLFREHLFNNFAWGLGIPESSELGRLGRAWICTGVASNVLGLCTLKTQSKIDVLPKHRESV